MNKGLDDAVNKLPAIKASLSHFFFFFFPSSSSSRSSSYLTMMYSGNSCLLVALKCVASRPSASETSLARSL